MDLTIYFFIINFNLSTEDYDQRLRIGTFALIPPHVLALRNPLYLWMQIALTPAGFSEGTVLIIPDLFYIFYYLLYVNN